MRKFVGTYKKNTKIYRNALGLAERILSEHNRVHNSMIKNMVSDSVRESIKDYIDLDKDILTKDFESKDSKSKAGFSISSQKIKDIVNKTTDDIEIKSKRLMALNVLRDRINRHYSPSRGMSIRVKRLNKNVKNR